MSDFFLYICPSINLKDMENVRLSRRKTTPQFIQEATQVHNGFYNYDKSVYVTAKEKLTVTCPIHGDFEVAPHHHTAGIKCRQCSPGSTLGVFSVDNANAHKLEWQNIKATFFHGGLPLKEKNKNMDLWMQESVHVIVATNAFGMGIDKPNVKTVIHYSLPDNLEGYYQEAGRAGRNGNKCFAVLLLSNEDVATASNQLQQSIFDKDFLKLVFGKICSHFQIPYGEGFDDEYSFDLWTFCDKYHLPLQKTHNAIQFLDRQSVLQISPELLQRYKIQFLKSSAEVIQFATLQPIFDPILKTLARHFTGIFTMPTLFNIKDFAKKASLPQAEVESLLAQLMQKGVLSFEFHKLDTHIRFLQNREDEYTINKTVKNLKLFHETKLQQFQAVAHYAEDQKVCKNKILLGYFDQIITDDCGVCSTCLKNKATVVDLDFEKEKVLKALNTKALSSKELQIVLDWTDEQLVKIIRILLDENRIEMNKNLYKII